MAQFQYRAFSRAGAVIEGILEAPAERDVLLSLRKKNLKVLLIEEKRESWIDYLARLKQAKISARDIVRFTNMFSTLVNAGIPISSCMRTLELQSENPAMKSLLRNVMQEIEEGMDLSTALSMHPAVFDRMYIDLIRAGEAGGALGEVLLRLAEYTEKADKMRRRLKGAMVYPAVVCSIAVIIVWVILHFVVPQFAETFAGAGKTLPLPTLLLLSASDVIRNYWYLIVGAGIAAFFGIKFALKNPNLRRRWDIIALKIPIYGELVNKAAMARFARTLAMLLNSGVPIIQALQIVSHVTGNILITEALLEVRDAITGGEGFTEPLKSSGIFPPLAVQMVSVGESTGDLPGMLNKAADFFEDEVNMVIESISTLIEPLMVVFLGVVLGYVIISLFLPILSLSETVPF